MRSLTTFGSLGNSKATAAGAKKGPGNSSEKSCLGHSSHPSLQLAKANIFPGTTRKGRGFSGDSQVHVSSLPHKKGTETDANADLHKSPPLPVKALRIAPGLRDHVSRRLVLPRARRERAAKIKHPDARSILRLHGCPFFGGGLVHSLKKSQQVCHCPPQNR